MRKSKPGPKPVPTAILKLRGSWRGQTREGEPEVETVDEVPCPEWVGVNAKKHWPQVSVVLKGLGILSPTFSLTMCALVTSIAVWIRFQNRADEVETDSATEKGPYVHPIHSQALKAMHSMVDLAARFGLDPSSITQIKSLKDGDEKPQGIGRFKLNRG